MLMLLLLPDDVTVVVVTSSGSRSSISICSPGGSPPADSNKSCGEIVVWPAKTRMDHMTRQDALTKQHQEEHPCSIRETTASSRNLAANAKSSPPSRPVVMRHDNISCDISSSAARDNDEEPLVLWGAFAATVREDGVLSSIEPRLRAVLPGSTCLPSEEYDSSCTTNIVEATKVVEDGESPILLEAQPVDTEAAASRRRMANAKIQKMLVFIFVLMTSIILLVIFLVLGIGDTHDKSVETPAPTAIVSTTDGYLFSLLPEYTKNEITRNPSSAQSQAFDWMQKDPHLVQYTSDRILQRLALATLYFATHGAHWEKNDGWLSYSLHECNWTFVLPYGIGYGEYERQLSSPCQVANGNTTASITNGTVAVGAGDFYTHLRLFSNNLQGTLPPEISFLSSSLVTINLDMNKLTGTLPSELARLTQLEYLSLSINSLSGTVPNQMGSMMTALRELYLDTNLFTGSLPNEIANMESLEWFWMFRTFLTGTLPSIWTHGITEMMLFDNQITGTLPTTLGTLTRLNYNLMLDTNELTGPIQS